MDGVDTNMKQAVLKIKRERLGGKMLSWLQAGSLNKPILLMIHGFPDDAFIWEEQIKHFKKDHLVIAPFLRGTTQNTNQIQNTEQIILDLLLILRKFDPHSNKDIWVMGHDIGSAYAWQLTSYLQQRLKGLIIINGANPIQFTRRVLQKPKQALKSWYMPLLAIPVLNKQLWNAIPDQIKKRVIEQGGGHHNSAHLQAASSLTNHYRALFKNTFENIIEKKIPEPVNNPVLSLSAKSDLFLEPANLAELETLSHQPTVRVIEGNHWIQKENPDRVNKLIRKFFNSCSQL